MPVFVSWCRDMKVSDVDIEKIYKLLKSVPQGMEIESINLTDGYSLRLIAGTAEIDKIDYDNSLRELQKAIKSFNTDVKKIGG